MTRLRLAAWIVIVAMTVLGFWRVEEVQRKSCERSNEFRSEDLPAAFDAFAWDLGGELGAEPEQIAQFSAEFDSHLDELFPHPQLLTQ